MPSPRRECRFFPFKRMHGGRGSVRAVRLKAFSRGGGDKAPRPPSVFAAGRKDGWRARRFVAAASGKRFQSHGSDGASPSMHPLERKKSTLPSRRGHEVPPITDNLGCGGST